MRRHGNAANLHRPSCARGPRVHRSLQVHMLERGQLTRHHRMVPATRSEKIAHQRRNLIHFPAGSRMDPVQKTAKRRRELAGLILCRLIGHALDLQFQRPPPTAGTRSRAYRRGSVTAATPSPRATCSQLTPGPGECSSYVGACSGPARKSPIQPAGDAPVGLLSGPSRPAASWSGRSAHQCRACRGLHHGIAAPQYPAPSSEASGAGAAIPLAGWQIAGQQRQVR